MLWINFLLTNFHFAVSLFGIVTCLILVYVLLGAFFSSRAPHTLFRAFGFLALAGYLSVHAWQGATEVTLLFQVLRIISYLLIFISFYKDPLQNVVPKASAFVLPFSVSRNLLGVATLVVVLATMWRIYKKYSTGLEREYKNLHRGFLLLGFFEIFHALTFFKDSANVFLANLASPTGLFFILSHLFLASAFVFILIYAWGYLRFELFTQIFGSFIISSVVVFVISASIYTFLLIRQMAVNAESALKVDLATFNYSINRLREQGEATATVIAVSDEIAASVGNEKALQEVTDKTMVSSGVDFLAILDKAGRVLVRADGYQATGASMSGNFVVGEAIGGNTKTNITLREWVNAPLVVIEVATPASYGIVYTGYILDSAFVDGYKSATGLETSIYAGEVKAATTYVAPDGVTRLVGAVQTSQRIKSEVLERGNVYTGLSSVFQNEYVSAYGPYKSEAGEVLGMYFVGLPSSQLYEAARVSVNTTFLVIIILAIFSFVPAYFFAKFIERNQA